MAKQMWKAEIECLLDRLNDPKPLDDVQDRLDHVFTVRERKAIEEEAVAIIEDQGFVLFGRGSIICDEQVEKTMAQHVTNAKQSYSNQWRQMRLLRKQIAELTARLERQRGYVIGYQKTVQAYYDGLPPDQKKFWSAPVYSVEEPDWMEKFPEPVDPWYAVRPDLLSPIHVAYTRALKRKLEGD